MMEIFLIKIKKKIRKNNNKYILKMSIINIKENNI